MHSADALASSAANDRNAGGYGEVSHDWWADQNRPNQPPAPANAVSQAAMKASSGASRPDSTRLTVEASHGTSAPNSASVRPPATRARRISLPR